MEKEKVHKLKADRGGLEVSVWSKFATEKREVVSKDELSWRTWDHAEFRREGAGHLEEGEPNRLSTTERNLQMGWMKGNEHV